MSLTRVQPSALDKTLNYTANTFTANYITFGDGTTQTTAGVATDQTARNLANTANTLAQSAFDKANTSSSGYLPNSVIFANTTGYLSNTNTLKFYTSNNTLLTTSLTLNAGAGGQITFADGTTQATAASGASTDQTARNLANTANTLAQNAFDKGNTANNLAQSAFDKANSANTLAQTAFDKGNTANTLAQSGFDKANTANTLAQTSFDKANTANTLAQSAFDKANTSSFGYLPNSVIFANTTGYLSNVSSFRFYTSNNTLITTSLTLSSGAGGQITFADGTTQATAAAGAATDQTARNLANTANTLAQSAFDKANTANTLAQSAFDKANTGGGSSSNSFSTILVSGQSNVIANTPTSILTLVAGSGITITTAQTSNTITFNSTGGFSGGTITNQLTIANSTSSISNGTGALIVQGGVGVTGNIYIGANSVMGFANSASNSVVYQVYNATTNSLDTIFG